MTVGSETLYRGNFTGAELLAKIRDVKAILPDTKVGTADSWNKFADGTADAVIEGGVDLLMANGFAYWQGKQVGQGAEHTYFEDMAQALERVQTVGGDVGSGEGVAVADGEADFRRLEQDRVLERRDGLADNWRHEL